MLQTIVSYEEFVEIDEVRIEFRTVDTGELNLAADRHTTGAAHPRPIDHYRVQTHYRLHPVVSCDASNDLHHYHRSGCHYEVYSLTPSRRCSFKQVPQNIADEALTPLRAVVRRHVKLIAHLPHLFLQNKQVFGPCSDYRNHIIPGGFQRARSWVYGCDSDAAADAHHAPVFFNARRHA